MKKLLFPVIALTLVLLMSASVSASAEVIWTIGINNNSRIEFKPDSASEIFYKVGDNVNENFPSRLDSEEVNYPSYVEIEFTTTVPYADVSLLYDRWGAETDKVWFDSMLLGTCAGTEDKNSINYFFDVGVVLPGTYTIKIEILLNGGDGFHGIDQLQLSGNLMEPTVTTRLSSGPTTVSVGELPVPTWTITIKICQSEVNLNNVVVQGGIGADLVVTGYLADEGDVDLIKKGKPGKMGATIVRWDVGDLEAGSDCLELVLTFQTGLNPQGKQEFTSMGLHDLDGGFSATYWYEGMEYETPGTDPLTVDVE
jgi:hypothetical protein